MDAPPDPKDEDSADDVFAPVGSVPGAADSYGDNRDGLAQKEREAEGMVEGGTSYLPSHPEPILPQEDPKVPPVPISLSDENYQRGNWGSKFEFLAAVLCQLTPISIFTSFHYRIYSNGGLIFILPYMLLVFFLGFPVILLAFSLGQFASSGFLTSWTFIPIFKGFSVYVFLQTFSSMVFINIILQKAYSYMYVTLVSSSALPWTNCSNVWNTDSCRDGSYVAPGGGGPISSSEQSDRDAIMSILDPSPSFDQYESYPFQPFPTTPSDEYYRYLYGGGLITWVSFVGALAAFVVVVMATMLGVKVVGKFCIGTLAASFMLTIVLLIRSCTLPGAPQGYQYLFVPDINRLFHDQLWKNAFVHVIFLLSFAFWPCLGLASHNRFHNNCFLDTALMVMAIIFSPVMIAIAVFCMNGFLAQQLGVPITDIVSGGPDVVFSALPYALSYLPKAPLWNMVWFGLLALNLLSSQVGTCLAMVSSILDLFGWVHSWRRIMPVTFALCAVIFVCTLVTLFVGVDVSFGIFDFGMTALAPVPIIALSVSLVWLYGSLQKIHVLRWANDVASMVGFFPAFFKVTFSAMWAVVVPAAFTAAAILLFCDLVFFASVAVIASTSLAAVITFGITLLVLAIGFISGAIHETYKHLNVNTYFSDFFYRAALPRPQWGPALDTHRHYAGYLPRDFTPQPYPLSHRADMAEEQVIGTVEGDPKAQNEAPGVAPESSATLPVTTPLISPNPTTNETLL